VIHSESGRALMPAHMEQSRIFQAIENAMRLTDYRYTVEPKEYKIVVHIGDENLEIKFEHIQ